MIVLWCGVWQQSPPKHARIFCYYLLFKSRLRDCCYCRVQRGDVVVVVQMHKVVVGDVNDIVLCLMCS